MTVAYRRVVASYKIKYNEDSVTGSECYLRDDVNADGKSNITTLPIVGTTPFTDPFGNVVATCLCRTQIGTFDGNDPGSLKWQFNYDVNKPGAGPAQNTETNPNARRYECGIEITSIENPIPDSGVDPKIPVLYFFIPTMTFTIPTKMPLTITQKNSLIAVCEANCGRINLTAFEGHRKGSVRFDGMSGGTKVVKDNPGVFYQFELKFTKKIVPSVAGEWDWNYVLDKTGAWKLYSAGNLDKPFPRVEFNSTLAGYINIEAS